MRDRYSYQKPVHRSHLPNLWPYVLGLIVVGLVVALGFYLYSNFHGKKKLPTAISPFQTSIISSNMVTYTSPYFKFQDNGGKWVLEKNRSTNNEFIYDKYQGDTLEGEIVFYVNKEANMEDGYTRVLPVRIVNNNSFQVTGVSDPCVSQYGQAPHITKEIEFENTLMYCDAGDNDYSVVVGEIGGDYHLDLKLSNGTPIQFEITYIDDGLDPGQGSLLNVVDSFQTT